MVESEAGFNQEPKVVEKSSLGLPVATLFAILVVTANQFEA